jgi:hypothetical protein
MNKEDVFFISDNTGHEAFQLLYEHLIILTKLHDSDSRYLRNHSLYLTMFLNTFNRHYCGAIDSAFSVGEKNKKDSDQRKTTITPIFLSLKYNSNYKSSIHRLLAVTMTLSDKSETESDEVNDDSFGLVFDNPSSTKIEQDIIFISFPQFHETYYTKEIYSIERRHHDDIDLKFDEDTNNFYYEYDVSIDDSNRLIILNSYHITIGEEFQWVGFYPTYGDLVFQKRRKINNKTRQIFTDLTGIFRLFELNNDGRWKVDQRYIAKNRFISLEALPSQSDATTDVIDSYDKVNRITLLDLLYGIDDLNFVFDCYRVFFDEFYGQNPTQILSITCNNTVISSQNESNTTILKTINVSQYIKLPFIISYDKKYDECIIYTKIKSGDEVQANRLYINLYMRVNTILNTWLLIAWEIRQFNLLFRQSFIVDDQLLETIRTHKKTIADIFLLQHWTDLSNVGISAMTNRLTRLLKYYREQASIINDNIKNANSLIANAK